MSGKVEKLWTHQGLRRAMAAPWNGGAYGIILDDGAIRVGDSVQLLSP